MGYITQIMIPGLQSLYWYAKAICRYFLSVITYKAYYERCYNQLQMLQCGTAILDQIQIAACGKTQWCLMIVLCGSFCRKHIYNECEQTCPDTKIHKAMPNNCDSITHKSHSRTITDFESKITLVEVHTIVFS